MVSGRGRRLLGCCGVGSWVLEIGIWGLKFRCELEVGCECAGMCVDKSRGGLLRMHKEGKI